MPTQYAQAFRREAFKEWIKYDGWVKTFLLSWSKKEARPEQSRRGEQDGDIFYTSSARNLAVYVHVRAHVGLHVSSTYDAVYPFSDPLSVE